MHNELVETVMVIEGVQLGRVDNRNAHNVASGQQREALDGVVYSTTTSNSTCRDTGEASVRATQPCPTLMEDPNAKDRFMDRLVRQVV